jgi:hypothetical protein
VVVRAAALHPEVRRPELPEQHRSAGFLDLAAVLREALRPQAARPAPLMEPRSAQAGAPRRVRTAVARPAVLAVRRPARLSAEAGPKVRVRRRAEVVPLAQLPAAEPKGALRPAEQPGALAEAAAEVQREVVAPQALAAQPKAALEVLAEWDAAAGPQPVAASVAAGVRQPEEAAGQDAAVAVQRRAAGQAVAAAVRLRVAEAPDAAARRRAARGAQGALPSAAAWAGLPWTRCRGDRPAPSARARSAHAREGLRTAQR